MTELREAPCARVGTIVGVVRIVERLECVECFVWRLPAGRFVRLRALGLVVGRMPEKNGCTPFVRSRLKHGIGIHEGGAARSEREGQVVGAVGEEKHLRELHALPCGCAARCARQ